MPLPTDNDEPPSSGSPARKPLNFNLFFSTWRLPKPSRGWVAFFLTFLLSFVAWEHAEPDGALFSHKHDHILLTKVQFSSDLDAADPLLDVPPVGLYWITAPEVHEGLPCWKREPIAAHLGLAWLCRRQIEGG